MPSESSLLLCRKPAHVIEHPSKLICGYYTIAFILSIYGIDGRSIIPIPKGILGKWMPRGITPRRAQAILSEFGVCGKIEKMPHAGHAARIGFLQEQMRLGYPILMCVYGIGRLLPHWIVLAGMDTFAREYYVYDPRAYFGWGKPGTSNSHNKALPIGNRALEEGELMKLWAGCHLDLLGSYRFLAVKTEPCR